jgi:hypothetical protein
MSDERIAMWVKVCGASHPVFGSVFPSAKGNDTLQGIELGMQFAERLKAQSALEVKTVSHLCDCERCVGRTSGTYLLSASCYNCGKRHVAKFRVGDHHGYHNECPFCGVPALNYGTSEEADKMLQGIPNAKATA